MKTPVHQLLDIVVAAAENSDLYVTSTQYDFLHKICWKYRHEPLPVEIHVHCGENIRRECLLCNYRHSELEGCL